MKIWSTLLRTAACLIALCWASELAVAQTPTEQKKQLTDLLKQTQSINQLIQQGKLLKALENVESIQSKLLEVVHQKQKLNASSLRSAKLLYARIVAIRSKLELEGAEFDPLPSWKELTTMPPKTETKGVSFKTDVAPWLVSACGKCHINRSSGRFSLATFNDLAKGPPAGKVFFAGADKGNRLVEVIESGDMPRDNAKVTDEQLNALRQWIAEGAKFDGPDPNARLTTYVEGGAAQPNRTPPPKVVKATGNETVSFAKDIAPILDANCKGCHIAGRRASGGLRMDTFAQLLRGGDSGSMISVRKAMDSLLVKKIKGESGNRMPAGGRPALKTDEIELIGTWINEGAKFDGPSPATNINTVINQAWADAATHEELFERRKKEAIAKWNRVLPNDQPQSVSNSEIIVLGNVPESLLQSTLKNTEKAVDETKRLLGADSGSQPLIKGGMAIFVLRSRYDYSEFGRMTENRELPKDWLGHWHADPVDAYGVLIGDSNIDPKQAASVTLQVVSATYLGSFQGTPNWFAEGVARNLVYRNHRRDDPRVKVWQASMPAASRQVKNAKSVVNGSLDEEVSGLVGMSLANFMMDRSNKRRFDNLLAQLRSGKNFDAAMTASFAKPEAVIKVWLGK